MSVRMGRVLWERDEEYGLEMGVWHIWMGAGVRDMNGDEKWVKWHIF